MPQRGWYPDPDATPGRYRFWDGNAWTGDTTFQPQAAAPGDPDERRRRVGARGRLLTTGILVVLLLMTLVGTVAVIQSRDRTSVAAPAPARPSTSAWDDSSPTPSTTTVTPSVSPSPTASPRLAECDTATADQLGAPAADGRVHGGPLSFRRLPSPWAAPSSTGRFPFSRDSQVQTLRLPEKLPWQASAQVGVVAFERYPGGHVAAETMLNCLLTSDFYTSVDVTVATSTGRDLSIDGHRASRLDALLTFTHPELKTRGSEVRIIVVDTAPVTYYFHAVPQERRDLITALDTATDSLAAT
ncbi:MAG: DUF2510 domain-containing protein [Propionibacteriaceae bacterium]